MGSCGCWERTGRITGCLTEGWDFDVVPSSEGNCWLENGIEARCSLESPLELAPPLEPEMALRPCLGVVPLLGAGGGMLATGLGWEILSASGAEDPLETVSGGFATGLG